jgi:hypothetical protein
MAPAPFARKIRRLSEGATARMGALVAGANCRSAWEPPADAREPSPKGYQFTRQQGVPDQLHNRTSREMAPHFKGGNTALRGKFHRT